MLFRIDKVSRDLPRKEFSTASQRATECVFAVDASFPFPDSYWTNIKSHFIRKLGQLAAVTRHGGCSSVQFVLAYKFICVTIDVSMEIQS